MKLRSNPPLWLLFQANNFFKSSFLIFILQLQTSLDIVGENLRKSQQQQRSWRNIEFRDRYVQERNYERVNFWSIVNTVILLGTAVIQVVMIRSLFGGAGKVRT